jgi:branched-chain amino acid transport system ATP-binding protein
MSEAPLLELEDVHAFYGSAHILEGVSFSMGTEAIALIGRNGMGKSTLCNTIMGLCRETRGSIRVAGREVRGRWPARASATCPRAGDFSHRCPSTST